MEFVDVLACIVAYDVWKHSGVTWDKPSRGTKYVGKGKYYSQLRCGFSDEARFVITIHSDERNFRTKALMESVGEVVVGGLGAYGAYHLVQYLAPMVL